jgi:hypothetical protein
LSSQTEHSEGPSILPPPELNPLLNPLLAENMGRWAQVYFTAPPEKREQAVQELVRELEAENSTRAQAVVAASSLVTPSSVGEQGSEPVGSPAPLASQVHPTLVRCHACGRKNPSSQRFCGMCGTRLGEGGAAADLHRDDPHGDDLHVADLHIEDQGMENPFQDEPAPFVQNQESHFVPRDHDVYKPRLNTNELSLFQSMRDVGYNDEYPDEILSPPHTSGSYRLYVGIVLTIIIGALAYMAWRGAQATSQTSHLETPAPPAATTEPATSAPAPPSPAKTDTPDRAASAENQAAGPSREAAEPPRAKPVRNAATTRSNKASAPRRTPRPEKTPQAEALAGTGAEELAVAQRYLNGTNGQGRNSAEAAKWLWKAMAKHNGDAPLLLSDLYLKGDGVSKNCDQARVLLDAAALKGVKDAGQRLRHLQAFGCQ